MPKPGELQVGSRVLQEVLGLLAGSSAAALHALPLCGSREGELGRSGVCVVGSRCPVLVCS